MHKLNLAETTDGAAEELKEKIIPLWNALKENKGKDFPFRNAYFVSREISLRLGLRFVIGEYRGKFSKEYRDKILSMPLDGEWNLFDDFWRVPYSFNYDPKSGLYVDCTSSQFHPENPVIDIIPDSPPGTIPNRIAYNNLDLPDSVTHLVKKITHSEDIPYSL